MNIYLKGKEEDQENTNNLMLVITIEMETYKLVK